MFLRIVLRLFVNLGPGLWSVSGHILVLFCQVQVVGSVTTAGFLGIFLSNLGFSFITYQNIFPCRNYKNTLKMSGKSGEC